MANQEIVKKLKAQALQLRYDVLEMVGIGSAGHIGGSMSLAEIIAVLYFHKMNFSKELLSDPGRDRLILSKGHAALAQYAALGELGCFSRDAFRDVKALGGLLQGHPDLSIPGIEAVTGSLGQGLSIGLGMALALRLDKSKARVYVIMGDGEQSEGQVWEAAQAAAFYKVDNMLAFIDWNKQQASGHVNDVFVIPDFDKKWAAFGWDVQVTDGHDPEKIIDAIEKAETVKGKPSIIILETVKGKGISFAENNAAYHSSVLDNDKYNQAKADLDKIKAGL